MFEQPKEMNAELETLKKAHLEKSKTMFTAVAKQVFEKHPILESFSWTQYTPYFNDGDECTFSANVEYPKVNSEDEDDGDQLQAELYTDDRDPVTKQWIMKPNPKYNKPLADAYETVKEFLANIDESVLRDMFGDHVEVTVTPNGTSVEECSHD